MERLFQVQAEVRRESGELDLVRIGPAWSKEAAEHFLIAVNGQISLGNEKHFRNPHIVPAIADLEVN